jgi:hypothetical protein
VALICTEISADDQSFGVENHDVVTTWESKCTRFETGQLLCLLL